MAKMDQAGGRPRPGVIRVLVVEDHASIRLDLRAAMEDETGLCLAGKAATWPEGLALDVMFLDLYLPAGNGWNLIHQLRGLGALPPTDEK